MKGFVGDIEEMTEENVDFRRVLYTAKKMQLVLMALQPGEEIGKEVHNDRDQFFRVEKGKGEIWIDGNMARIKSDMAMIVPAGARHNVKNTSELCTPRNRTLKCPKSILTGRPLNSRRPSNPANA